MKRFLDLFRVPEVKVLTHVPVQAEGREAATAEKARKEKLAVAKAKYCKPFVLEVRLARETEPSIVLIDIERRAMEEKNARRPVLAKVVK